MPKRRFILRIRKQRLKNVMAGNKHRANEDTLENYQGLRPSKKKNIDIRDYAETHDDLVESIRNPFRHPSTMHFPAVQRTTVAFSIAEQSAPEASVPKAGVVHPPPGNKKRMSSTLTRCKMKTTHSYRDLCSYLCIPSQYAPSRPRSPHTS